MFSSWIESLSMSSFNTLNTLLDKEETTLEQVLNEESVVNEARDGN